LIKTNSYTEKVSIIMSCYNNGEFAAKSVNSILAQDYTEWELIVVDDCSTDNTWDILESLKELDKRIQLIRSVVNLGAGGARNLALAQAHGRYVAFLDADDLWLPNKLSTQLNFMHNSGAAISHTSYEFIDSSGEACSGRVLAHRELDLVKYMITTEIGMSTAVVDRSLVGDITLNLARTRQDTILWLTLLSRGFKSFPVKETLVLYRIRAGQISSNKLKMALRTYSVYRNYSGVNEIKVIFYFILYCLNALKKRL